MTFKRNLQSGYNFMSSSDILLHLRQCFLCVDDIYMRNARWRWVLTCPFMGNVMGPLCMYFLFIFIRKKILNSQDNAGSCGQNNWRNNCNYLYCYILFLKWIMLHWEFSLVFFFLIFNRSHCRIIYHKIVESLCKNNIKLVVLFLNFFFMWNLLKL